MNLQSLIKTAFFKAGFSVKKIRRRARPAPPGATSGGELRSGEALRALLHRQDPYLEFSFQDYPFDAQGWGGDSPVFRKLIQETRPTLVIEVGTWKGASALQMAAVAQEAGLPTQILCVDTWLGALEFWNDQNDPERYGALGLRHGYPTVYYQFLANVCHRRMQRRIVPFPQTSATAAVWLRMHAVQAELIYIDGSHEEEDVYQDLASYWDLVAAGGVLFGDDYGWDGVRLALQRFAAEERLKIEFLDDKWLLRRGGVAAKSSG